MVCAAQQLKHYYNPEDLCGEEWELIDEAIASLDRQGAASPMEIQGGRPDMNAEEMVKEGFYMVREAYGSHNCAGRTCSERHRRTPGPRPAPGAGNGPPRNREPTPSTSGRTKIWRNGKAGQPETGGATSGAWWSSTHQERLRHAQGPHHAKVTPAPSP